MKDLLLGAITKYKYPDIKKKISTPMYPFGKTFGKK
jgi:hypothetical protein